MESMCIVQSSMGLVIRYLCDVLHDNTGSKGARWPSGRASDSKSRGPGFDPHNGHCVVSLSKTR